MAKPQRFSRTAIGLLVVAAVLVVGATGLWLYRLADAISSPAAIQAQAFVDLVKSGQAQKASELCAPGGITKQEIESFRTRYKKLFALPEAGVTFAELDGKTAHVLVRFSGNNKERYRVEIRLVQDNPNDEWKVMRMILLDAVPSR